MGGAQQGGRRGNVRRGADLRYDLEIGLEDAYHGRQVELQVDTTAGCEPCGGTRRQGGHSAQSCATCGGRGQVRARQGFFVVEQTCPTCRGVGEMIADPCPSCRGEGRVEKGKRSRSTFPPASTKAPASASPARARRACAAARRATSTSSSI